eukprot:352587-Chlamydomonas_euryale.AAC.1
MVQATAPERSLSVCEVCGVFISAMDADQKNWASGKVWTQGVSHTCALHHRRAWLQAAGCGPMPLPPTSSPPPCLVPAPLLVPAACIFVLPPPFPFPFSLAALLTPSSSCSRCSPPGAAERKAKRESQTGGPNRRAKQENQTRESQMGSQTGKPNGKLHGKAKQESLSQQGNDQPTGKPPELAPL